MKTLTNCFRLFCISAFALGLAQAQASRTWVSGVGDDANPCSRTAPCKTFAGAISKTAAGGEIDALDPGGFGAVTITKSITIDGSLMGSILVSGTNGITVNAGSGDTVTLRNLSINGIGTGISGVRFLNGKALHIENCAISNFTRGIDIGVNGTSQIFVVNTVSRDNGESGIRVSGTSSRVFVAIDKSRFQNNGAGIWAADYARFSVRDSDISGNDTIGVVAEANGGDVIVNLTNTTVSNNMAAGIRAGGGSNLSIVRLDRTAILSNAVDGIITGSNGQVVSVGNNYNAGTGGPTAMAPLQ